MNTLDRKIIEGLGDQAVSLSEWLSDVPDWMFGLIFVVIGLPVFYYIIGRSVIKEHEKSVSKKETESEDTDDRPTSG